MGIGFWVGEHVYMINNNLSPVSEIRKVTLRLISGKLIDLTSVRFVPGLRRNLVSLGQSHTTTREVGITKGNKDSSHN